MSAGMAEATAQMCSTKAEAKAGAAQSLRDIVFDHGYTVGKITYKFWTVDVGPITYHYCKAQAEVLK